MKLGPLLVRDVNAHGAIPPKAWADVVRRVGGLVLATATTTRRENGELSVAYAVNLATVDRVRLVLREHGARFRDPDLPVWLDETPPEPASPSWERDADWWKG